MKKVALLGSTGSIGINTLNIIRRNTDKFKLEVLVAGSNVELLSSQVKEFKPKYVGIRDKDKYLKLKELLSGLEVEIFAGSDEVDNLAKQKVDISIIAIVGSAAIVPTVNAIRSGNNIGLANKESLVCAGSLIMNLVKEYNVQLIPIDSEHSGLFQVFPFEKRHLLKEVIITASGGPFRDATSEQMQNVTKEQALKHPNWSMGAKITIDSATLVNKCLEVIEACHLFSLHSEQVKVLIHYESIIHAMINFVDGSCLAHMGKHNMQIPISYALFYPERALQEEFNNFSLADYGKLHFEKADKNKFKSLKIVEPILDSLNTNLPIVFNVANELAVDAFLKDKINFIEITDIIEKTLQRTTVKEITSIQEVLDQIKQISAEFKF